MRLKEGFDVKALKYAMRAVEVNPGDGERAIEEMRAAGAEIVETSSKGNQQPERPGDSTTEDYMNGVDRTLIRQNLRLSVTERFQQLMALQRFAAELQSAGREVQRGD